MSAPVFSHADEPQAAPTTGTCPECWGTVPLAPGGLIDRHNVRVISHGIETNSKQPCIGRGQLPETKEN